MTSSCLSNINSFINPAIYIGYGNWKILALLYYIVVITILVQKLIS